MTETKQTPRHTAMSHIHKAAGARMTNFAGWWMPIQYEGIMAEHRTVRKDVGLFDISHMGEVTITGPDRAKFVDFITTNKASVLTPHQVQYACMTLPDGGIVDDLLVYAMADRFYLVVNASSHQKDLAHMQQQAAGFDVNIQDVSHETSLIGIQGPKAEQVMSRVFKDADLPSLAYYHFMEQGCDSSLLIISRTGYTGEDGFEIYGPWDMGPAVWEALMNAGQEYDIKPIGLGARDTLRLEVNYCLYGHEIDETINPLEAGLGWIVKLDKNDFLGKEALQAIKTQGPARKLAALEMTTRAIPRQGYPVFFKGAHVGEVKSGTHSPSLGKGIATAILETSAATIGAELEIEIRGKRFAAVVIKPPFYKQGSLKR